MGGKLSIPQLMDEIREKVNEDPGNLAALAMSLNISALLPYVGGPGMLHLLTSSMLDIVRHLADGDVDLEDEMLASVADVIQDSRPNAVEFTLDSTPVRDTDPDEDLN